VTSLSDQDDIFSHRLYVLLVGHSELWSTCHSQMWQAVWEFEQSAVNILITNITVDALEKHGMQLVFDYGRDNQKYFLSYSEYTGLTDFSSQGDDSSLNSIWLSTVRMEWHLCYCQYLRLYLDTHFRFCRHTSEWDSTTGSFTPCDHSTFCY
jgi:hypothetical protein